MQGNKDKVGGYAHSLWVCDCVTEWCKEFVRTPVSVSVFQSSAGGCMGRWYLPSAGLSLTSNKITLLERRFDPVLPCNANCSCDARIFEPVCGADGRTYVNACLAGCRQRDVRRVTDNDTDTRQLKVGSGHTTSSHVHVCVMCACASASACVVYAVFVQCDILSCRTLWMEKHNLSVCH